MPDQLIPGVELLGELGRGADTVVYRAVRDGQQYAVKVLRRVGDDRVHAAFRREAAMLATLEHPGLARVHEVGQVAGQPYLIMDLVAGRSLAEVLRAAAPMSGSAVARIGAEIAEILGVAHRNGMVHRDVKPTNIMMSPAGRAGLIDFGLAGRSGLETGDVTVGTFRYSAPEQTGMLHRPVDGRSDLYSLGVVLFECLAGAPPFTDDDVSQLIRRHLTDPVPDLRQICPRAPGVLVEVIEILLAKDPDNRYQRADALGADLARIAAGDLDFAPGASAGQVVDRVEEPIGRDREADWLAEHWQRTRAGTGTTVLIEGAPGAGKSRLAQALADTVRGAGHPVLSGKCDDDNRVPLGPIHTAIQQHMQGIARLDDGPRAQAEDQVRAAARPVAGLLRSLSPELAALLAVTDADSTLVSHVDQDRFAEAVAAFLAALGERLGGLLLHVDDVQWADEATRRVLHSLAARTAQTPLLLVLTARDDEAAAPAVDSLVAGFGPALGRHLRLGPLTEEAVAALIFRQLGAHLPIGSLARLTAHAGGNPLMIGEYVRAAIDSGLLVPHWGSWQLDEAGLDALALPTDLMELVLRRVDLLGGRHRRLLTAAAAVGMLVPPQLVAAVCDVDQDTGLTALRDAVSHQLLRPAEGGLYAFIHDRIREALLGSIDPADRRALHRRIGDELWRQWSALGTDDAAAGEYAYPIARHYLLGGPDHAPERLFHAAALAGRLALDEYAADDAFELLQHADAAARCAGIPTDAAFHTDFGSAAMRLGSYALAEQQLLLALDKQRDPACRATLFGMLANTYHPLMRGPQAAQAIRDGLTEIGAPLPRSTVLMIVSTLWLIAAGILIDLLPRRRRLARGAERDRLRLQAGLLSVGLRGMGSTMNRWMVIAMPLRANYVVKRLGPGPEYAAIRTGLGGIFAFAGRRTRADRIMAEVNRSIAGLHDPGLVASTQCLQAISSEMIVPTVGITGVRTRHALSAHGRWLSAGDYLHAVFVLGNTLLGRGHLTEAAEWHQRATARSGEAVSNATLGAQIAALAGRPAEAATSLGQARELVRATPSNYGQTLSIAVCAVRIAVESGDTGAGFEEAVREVDELNPTPSRIWNSHRFVFVHLAFGRLAQVVAQPPASRGEQLAQAAAAVATLRRMANGPVLRAYHRAALAFLEYLQGKHPAALRQLADLEISSADLDLPLLCYEMALLRARIHRDLGHPDHAVQQATVALTLAQRHGWPTRARWIRVEFDMSTPQLADQAQSQARSLHASTAKGHVDERRLGALQQVSLAAADAGSPARLAQVALDQIVSIFNAERAFLFLHDPGTDRLAPYLGRDHNGAELDALTGYGSTLIQRVADSGEALVVAGSEEGAALGSQSTMAHGLRSIMIAPMRLGERLIGLVYLDSRIAKGIFTTDDIDLLAAITTLFGLSLEMARAGELETAVAAAERERDLADRLRSATTQLGASLEPDEVAGTLTALVCQILHVDTAALVQRIAGKVMLMGAQDGVQPTLDPDLDPGLAAALAATEPCCGSRDSGLPPPPGPLGPDATSWLAIPLVLRGEHRGVLLAASAAPRGYSDAELHIAAALAGQGLAALDNAVLFQRVQDLATRDGLTGLFNRRHFTALTEQPATGPTSTAAIMVDIDHFKRINDTHGHPVGDDVIRTVAGRLHAALRDCDVICRYGGEEFAILLPDVTRPIAERISRRLLAAITSTPIPTAAGDLPVTVSIGVAGPGNLDDDVWALLGTADTALYQAKNGGRNQAVHLDAPPSHAH